ncbi:MAG: GNAT family N-acetyltransferase [Alphaproteobacteria bacterium]|nr:GNAT family N-acetyltransferase [Alphaproteobacteria bacterium]
MQDLSLDIIKLSDEKPKLVRDILQKIGAYKDLGYYERSLERQKKGGLEVIAALTAEEDLAGYCIYNRKPKYAYFKTLEIPEIQDLNVLPQFRRNGIGRSIILFCEALARVEKHKEIGIGVGLDQSFGTAQRLYVKMGYLPDGSGISYDRKQVAAGEFRPIDDLLCLMMTKTLDR